MRSYIERCIRRGSNVPIKVLRSLSSVSRKEALPHPGNPRVEWPDTFSPDPILWTKTPDMVFASYETTGRETKLVNEMIDQQAGLGSL